MRVILSTIITKRNLTKKPIERFRAIDVNSLFGYMGGYVGVLVGFSILQIPDLLLETFARIKRLGSCIPRDGAIYDTKIKSDLEI